MAATIAVVLLPLPAAVCADVGSAPPTSAPPVSRPRPVLGPFDDLACPAGALVFGPLATDVPGLPVSAAEVPPLGWLPALPARLWLPDPSRLSRFGAEGWAVVGCAVGRVGSR